MSDQAISAGDRVAEPTLKAALEPSRTRPSSNGQHFADAPIRTLTGVQILSSGLYVPDQVVTNQDLERSHGFDSDWIINRTGIQERRFAPPHQATSDLCEIAAQRCLEGAGCRPEEVDLLIVGTMTPDMAFPSTGCLVQDRLNLRCPAFDLQAACAGFAYALVTGAQFVAAGTSKRALIIGGDCNSRVINPDDQKSFPLFGDGAGAVLLGPGSPEQGLLAYQVGSEGGGGDLLNRPACGSRLPPSIEAIENGLHYLTMDGRAVFKWAVRVVADSAQAVLDHAGCSVDQIRWFVPHQANVRIIHAASDVLGFDRSQVFKNLERFGNTSGGSIPIALDELRQAGAINAGDLLLISGFGAGLAWGTLLLRV